MVDLVKIRKKKAEKKKADEAAAAAAAASPVILSRADDEGSPDSGDDRRPPANASPPESGDPSPSAGLRMTGDAAPLPDPLPGEEREDPAGDSLGDSSARRPDDSAAPTTSKLDKFKAEAGKRRETAATEEVTAEVARLEALTFLIAGEQYAVDIERIVEIVTPRPVTRIPNSDPSVLGIISLRGTIVTLLDVRQKLRHPSADAPTADTRIVVIDSGMETVGFTVDRVLRVVKTARSEVEPHPIVHAGETNEAILGVFRTGGSLTILLDLDKLLDHNALEATQA